MNCEFCGAELRPGVKFCVNCGAKVDVQPRDSLVPVNPEVPAITTSSVLTWGIIAAAFACTGFLSFLGIIFGIIALRRADNYLALYGPGSKQVKIGHILSKVGIFAGIGMTVFIVLYIIFIVVLASASYYY